MPTAFDVNVLGTPGQAVSLSGPTIDSNHYQVVEQFTWSLACPPGPITPIIIRLTVRDGGPTGALLHAEVMQVPAAGNINLSGGRSHNHQGSLGKSIWIGFSDCPSTAVQALCFTGQTLDLVTG